MILLAMPLSYMLTPKLRFYQMAIRLMERETFQLYQKAAQRLGYKEQMCTIVSFYRIGIR